MITCSKCGGSNVQHACWVDSNTNKVLGDFGSWEAIDSKYCHDCEENLELIDDDVPPGDGTTTRKSAHKIGGKEGPGADGSPG